MADTERIPIVTAHGKRKHLQHFPTSWGCFTQLARVLEGFFFVLNFAAVVAKVNFTGSSYAEMAEPVINQSWTDLLLMVLSLVSLAWALGFDLPTSITIVAPHLGEVEYKLRLHRRLRVAQELPLSGFAGILEMKGWEGTVFGSRQCPLQVLFQPSPWKGLITESPTWQLCFGVPVTDGWLASLKEPDVFIASLAEVCKESDHPLAIPLGHMLGEDYGSSRRAVGAVSLGQTWKGKVWKV
eukprot:gnl/TRDRNA2_/TRDRNA2_84072_c0_seq1.p1 gnl/TRDRNA2_/TRDRNA2_84072_c0~~gnl/TRDRNA2_/TRDRNA2_84072_c0_seq1.p1  ORF type:complete len:240 (-),score=29.31 gnl/TRDRNA2_/TRDRNA2_84072_c0_seq1:56-775(-)